VPKQHGDISLSLSTAVVTLPSILKPCPAEQSMMPDLCVKASRICLHAVTLDAQNCSYWRACFLPIANALCLDSHQTSSAGQSLTSSNYAACHLRKTSPALGSEPSQCPNVFPMTSSLTVNPASFMSRLMYSRASMSLSVKTKRVIPGLTVSL